MKSVRAAMAAFLVTMTASAAYVPAAVAAPPAPVDPRDPADPFIWLEDLDGQWSMDWVKAHNAVTEKRLEASPHYKTFYEDALALLGAKDRIPAPRFLNGEIYNFWQDEDHLRGIWRKTSLEDYRKADPQWQTVLDVDALGKAEDKSWVFKGARCLEPDQQRCLISLSDGGEDAVEVREFDLATGSFVNDGFVLPRAKQDIAWQDADHLLVATEWTPGDMTESGYAYIVKRVTRGQPLSEAVEIYRGETSDVGTTPSVLHDAQGHSLALIVRNVDFFHAQTFIVGADGVQQLTMPEKVSVADWSMAWSCFASMRPGAISPRDRSLRYRWRMCWPIPRP